MSIPSEFNEALARLDADIAEAEATLADLREKRKGADAFLAYMNRASLELSASSATGRRSSVPARSGAGVGPADAVLSIMRRGVVYSVDTARDATVQSGHELEREQVRNALHYLVRKKLIVSAGRGAWRLRDPETPAATGVSVSNIRPSQEGGESHETTEAPASAAEDQHHPQLGASITEVAS